MKLLMIVLIIALNSVPVFATETQHGYLVFTLVRLAYGKQQEDKKETYSFKILIDDDFKFQFINLPNPHRMGTVFSCNGEKPVQSLHMSGPATSFAWSVRYTSDRKLTADLSGYGAEKIQGVLIRTHNPSVSQEAVFKTWEDIHMRYNMSYTANYSGLNTGFEVKYYPASAIELEKIPFAQIRKSSSIKEDKYDNTNVNLRCRFNEQ